MPDRIDGERCLQEGAAHRETARKIAEKYERRSNTRHWTAGPRRVVRGALALLSLVTMGIAVFFTPPDRVWLPAFLGICILLGYVVFPHRKEERRDDHIPWFDVVLMAAGAGALFWFAFRGTQPPQLYSLAGWELVVGAVGLTSLGELCRRCVGLPLTCITAAALIFAFLQSSPARVMEQIFCITGEWGGAVGLPVEVCAKYIALFFIFGAFLEKAGSSSFFTDLAVALAGRSSGGPAKVAVIASALCGMTSGSSVGNTVSTGSTTIPMMKRAGCRGEFAGAVEAAASTGGQLIPPIMGAAAFLLAEAAQVPYSDVIRRALLPALLYFAGIFVEVHLEARKGRLKGLPREEVPGVWSLIRQKGFLLLPLLLLVMLIVTQPLPLTHVAVLSILAAIAAGAVNRDDMLTPGKALDALAEGARSTLTVAVSCSMAGIVVGVIMGSGLPELIILWSSPLQEGWLLPALVVVMAVCLMLGMVVPTTANFCILSAICVPVLTQLGADPLPAYFFLFYFGIVSDLTPPVAVAASAGAEIAGSDPLRTAGNATKLAIAGFIVPYIFVLSPSVLLIDTTPLDVVQMLISSMFGVFGIAAGLVGYFLRPMNWALRLLSVLGGLSLIYPGTMTDITGIIIILAVFSIQTIQNSRDPDSLFDP